jgi:hypothetical protein
MLKPKKMLRKRPLVAACVLLLMAGGGAASAQSRFYLGGSAGLEEGQRGNIDIDSIPAAGGLVGWRFHENWSIELHADRAFGESRVRVFEDLIYTNFTLTSEVYGRVVTQDRAGESFSLLGVWRSKPSGRVRAAVTMGFSERRFETHETMTISRVGPDVPLAPNHPLLQPTEETRTLRARGLTGGFMVPITLGAGLTVAPEIRLTRGLWQGFISTYAIAGARMMWGF